MNGMANLVALIFGGTFAWMVISRSGEQEGKGKKYMPYLFSGALPVYLTTLLVLNGIFDSGGELYRDVMGWVWVVVLHMSLYFLLLSLVLPLLRRHIQAGACAMLWIIPNYLYITYNTNRLTMPRWVIPLPWGWGEGLTLVWLAGTLAVLGWKIFSHLRFRRWLLRGEEPVSDPEVLAVWEKAVEWARMKRMKYRLVTSSQATTPMSIGLFLTSTRVVLPRRHYTPEELELIFHHELVHISREDAWNKFFLAFCTAICWFNPLMWLAVRRSSEDLELSCDETVLSELEAGERRRYADLILRTAGDGRGFTTCLSASATALRYRLKSIMKPGRKLPGALLVGAVFFLLYITCGQIGLAYGAVTGEEAIYGGAPQSVSLEQIQRETVRVPRQPLEVLECRDEGALEDYLSSLTLSEIVGRYGFPQQGTGEQLVLRYEAPEDTLSVILWSDYIQVIPPGENSLSARYYHVSGGLDWGKLEQMLEA